MSLPRSEDGTSNSAKKAVMRAEAEMDPER
jgi:hypothetical protein